MAKKRAITRGCDHQKTIGETDIVAKGEDPATTTTTVLIVKWPLDIRTITIKKMTVET
jgi:hypothetical protein